MNIQNKDYELFLLEIRLGKMLRRPVSVNRRENEIQVYISGRWLVRIPIDEVEGLLDEVEEADQSFQAAWEQLARNYLVSKGIN